LHVFDSNGHLRQHKDAEENIQIGLDLIDTLEYKTLSKTIKTIRKTLPKLLHYFDHASTIVKDLEYFGLNQDALKTLCAGWQWHRSLSRCLICQRQIKKESCCVSGSFKAWFSPTT
jgi:hypothetical protein